MSRVSFCRLCGLCGVVAATCVLISSLVGCAADATPSSADGDEAVASSEGDLSSRTPATLTAFEGQSYAMKSAAAHDGDVRQLRLYADGTYVRLRCYGAGCASAVAETDHFDAFRSSGKTYVEFRSFERVLVPGKPPKTKGGPSAPEYQDQPVVADTYEIKATPTGIKLRKTFSSRWLTLAAATEASLCAASGGTWAPPAVMPAPPVVDAASACHCAAGESYVAGGGGCQHVAVSTEDACDSTNGSYTDDDATRLGTYCACGIGRTMTDTGCVAITP